MLVTTFLYTDREALSYVKSSCGYIRLSLTPGVSIRYLKSDWLWVGRIKKKILEWATNFHKRFYRATCCLALDGLFSTTCFGLHRPLVNVMSVVSNCGTNTRVCSWFQTFAVSCMLYVFFWVIPLRLNFIYRRFGTLCLMEQTECSEKSAYKIQTPENYPEENIRQETVCSYMLLKNTWF